MTLHRVIFLIPAILALISGVWVGLLRGGVLAPVTGQLSIDIHGPLLISGFTGTVIGLERAVALGRLWVYAGPLLSALSVIALLVGVSPDVVAGSNSVAALILTLAYVPVYRVHKEPYVVVMATGAFLWFLGVVFIWMGSSVHEVILLWIGFPYLTVAGERMELSRFRMKGVSSSIQFYGAIILFFIGSLLHLWRNPLDSLEIGVPWISGAGATISGLGLLLATIWLFRNDISMRLLNDEGQRQFSSLAIVSAWFWSAIASVLLIVFRLPSAGPLYDASVHSIFLGFLMPMIFAHAPIIFPVVLGLRMVYGKHYYVHLILLHLGLVVRVTGDILLYMDSSQFEIAWFLIERGMEIGAFSIALFILATVLSLRRP